MHRLFRRSTVLVLALLVSGGVASARLSAAGRAGRFAPDVLYRLTASDVARMAAGAMPVPPSGAALLDIDRDGDTDVITSTVDAPIAIWINDGRGGFARTLPPRPPLACSAGPGLANALPGPASGYLPTPRWTAPAAAPEGVCVPDDGARGRIPAGGDRVAGIEITAAPPRAPPVSIGLR